MFFLPCLRIPVVFCFFQPGLLRNFICCGDHMCRRMCQHVSVLHAFGYSIFGAFVGLLRTSSFLRHVGRIWTNGFISPAFFCLRPLTLRTMICIMAHCHWLSIAWMLGYRSTLNNLARSQTMFITVTIVRRSSTSYNSNHSSKLLIYVRSYLPNPSLFILFSTFSCFSCLLAFIVCFCLDHITEEQKMLTLLSLFARVQYNSNQTGTNAAQGVENASSFSYLSSSA